jgi:micrococcal nuclease
MDTLFALILLLSLVGLIVGLISPRVMSKITRRTLSRKVIGLVFGGLLFFSMMGLARGAQPTPKNDQKTSQIEVKNDSESDSGDVSVHLDATEGDNSAVFSQNNDQEESPDTGSIRLYSDSEEASEQTPFLYPVAKVVDGDTIDVLIDGKTERLRLIGMDTPETVDPRKPVQCFGKEASIKMAALVSGKSVTLEADPSQGERDKYGRLLRYVFLENGQNVNLTMIAEGYAHEYTYNLPYKYQADFKAAEAAAKASGKGLWSPNTCNGDTSKAAAQATTSSPTTPTTASQPSTPTASTPAPTTNTNTAPASVTDGPPVKMSSSKKCHAKGTQYYDRTTKYTSYNTIEECLVAGGTLPQ